MALLQGAVVRRIPPELTKKSAVIGLYLIVPAFIIVGLAQNVALLYLGMFLYAVSTSFVVTCLTTLASKYGNFDQKGSVLGIFRSLGALARALGPVVSHFSAIGLQIRIIYETFIHFKVASTAFWSFGSQITYILGGLCLFYPTIVLQKLNLT